MAIEVRIPTILRSYTGGEKAVPAAGGTRFVSLWMREDGVKVDMIALSRQNTTAPVVGFDSFGEQFGPLLVNHTLVALAVGAEARS